MPALLLCAGAQVAELSDLADALSAAQDAASGMRWELLSKEAALSTLTKQLADAEETAQRAAAAQAVSDSRRAQALERDNAMGREGAVTAVAVF